MVGHAMAKCGPFRCVMGYAIDFRLDLMKNTIIYLCLISFQIRYLLFICEKDADLVVIGSVLGTHISLP